MFLAKHCHSEIQKHLFIIGFHQRVVFLISMPHGTLIGLIWRTLHKHFNKHKTMGFETGGLMSLILSPRFIAVSLLTARLSYRDLIKKYIPFTHGDFNCK